jgi:hypothetical protein
MGQRKFLVQGRAVALHAVWKRGGWAQPVSIEWPSSPAGVFLRRVSAHVDAPSPVRRDAIRGHQQKHATYVACARVLEEFSKKGREWDGYLSIASRGMYRLIAIGSRAMWRGVSTPQNYRRLPFQTRHMLPALNVLMRLLVVWCLWNRQMFGITWCFRQRVFMTSRITNTTRPRLQIRALPPASPHTKVLVFCSTKAKMPHLQEGEAALPDVYRKTEAVSVKGSIITTIGYLLLKAGA